MQKDFKREYWREKAEKLIELAEEAGTPLIVTAHRNADPDAIGSAYVIRNVLKRKGFDTRLLFPEGINQVSKRIVRELIGLEPSSLEDEAPKESALVIILDTASYEQLGSLNEFAKQVIKVIIDHHGSNAIVSDAELAIYDPSARATCELVYLLVRHGFKERLGKEELEALLAGIVYDTRHFLLATPRVLRVAADIIDEGADLDKVLKALQSPPPDISQRIARIKAAKRMHVIRANELIIAVTHVGAYEASAARALLDLGVDLAIVVSEHGSETRVVARAKKVVEEKYGIHLGRDIMEELARRLGGGGGGHSQAAAMSARASLERVLSETIRVVEEILKRKGLELQPIV